MTKSSYDFDDYLTEAAPIAFRLRVAGAEDILIAAPTGEQMLQVDEATTARAMLQALCGTDTWPAVFELVKDKHSGVLERLVRDLRTHFGLTRPPAGGSRP